MQGYNFQGYNARKTNCSCVYSAYIWYLLTFYSNIFLTEYMHDKTITELAEEPLKKNWIQLKKKYLTFFILLMNDIWIFRNERIYV